MNYKSEDKQDFDADADSLERRFRLINLFYFKDVFEF